MTTPWTEVAAGVFVRRYELFAQNIAAIVDGGEALVVDTRSSHAQGREILTDLRVLGAPRVAAVVNTHGHYDHAFGNRVFRPVPIWGHERVMAMLSPEGGQRELAAADLPNLADELLEVELDPPDRVFADHAVVEFAGRRAHLSFHGRGHTDNDVVVRVEGADVLLVGDLFENGATPYFGDGYPLDWPGTAEAVMSLAGGGTVVIPGHGDVAGRELLERQTGEFTANAALARRVQAGDLDLETAVAASPYPATAAREPLERALAQLRGRLG
jgi:glyoxylase-like metal-dependent hydrolase (beta-lactamase superfamily II)